MRIFLIAFINFLLCCFVTGLTATPANGGAFPAGNAVTGQVDDSRRSADRPTLTSITPDNVTEGTIVRVTLAGARLSDDSLSIDTGEHIEAAVIDATDATIVATLTVHAGAVAGPRKITVSTSQGSSVPVTLTVLPQTPTFTGMTPDLESPRAAEVIHTLYAAPSTMRHRLETDPPTILSISPASGARGNTVRVTLTGTNFSEGLTIRVTGSGITVDNVSVIDSQTVTADFVIAAGADPGVRNVVITSTEGTTASTAFTVLPQPTLTGISPATGVQNTNVLVRLRGTNFVVGLGVETISGVAVTNLVVTNSTTATAVFAIDANAAHGPREVRVFTEGGISETVLFTIVAEPPTLTGITPSIGILGTTVSVAFTGTNFTFGMSVEGISGITVTNINVTDSTNATAVFAINPLTLLGPRDISVTTPNGTSNTITFGVYPPAPTIAAINPTSGLQGTAVDVTLAGNNFFGQLTLAAGADIIVKDVNVSFTSITATLHIAVDAMPGDRYISVTTASGTTTVVFTVVPLPPTLSSVDPANTIQTTVTRGISVRLTGTKLYSPTISVGGTGVAARILNRISLTSVVAEITVQANASPGDREVTITTAGGTSSPVIFTVLPPTPTVTNIVPAIGLKGTSVHVALTGTNFVRGGTVFGSISGITISNAVVVNPTMVTATFTIADDAAKGTRSVTVATDWGTSEAGIFTVADPFPDLSISSFHTGRFGVGFNESYTIVVTNEGTLPAVGPMIVSDILPGGLTFVSGVGEGWSCMAAGQVINCTSSDPLAPGASSGFTLTVGVGRDAATTVNHTVSVTSAEDPNPANNSVTDVTTVMATPSPAFTFTPSPLVVGEQATVAIRLAVAFPHDLTGSITMTFSPSAVIPLDDPAIQFATGGRTVTFIILANETQARFGSASSPGPLAFQTGTVAGTLRFRGNITAGSVQESFPATAAGTSLTIPLQVPSIMSIQTSTPGGFEAAILLTSPSREVTAVSLTFDTRPKVKLNCGAAAGCSVSGDSITFDVAQLFRDWYTIDNIFGSMSLLRIPFNVAGGNINGKVAVKLTNSQGDSNSVSFDFR